MLISLPRLASRRRGLTLLEVLIALGIFLMSFAVIGGLISKSADWALEVQQQTRAAQLCQAKLAEVAAGVVPLSGQNDVPFDEDPKFFWSLDTSQADISGLWKITVRVHAERSDGSKVECSLDRMLLDPSLRGNAADVAMAAANSSSSGSSSGSSSSGSTGSSSATGVSASSGSSSGASSSMPKSSSSAPAAPSSGASAPKTSTSPAPSSSGSSKSASPSKGGS